MIPYAHFFTPSLSVKDIMKEVDRKRRQAADRLRHRRAAERRRASTSPGARWPSTACSWPFCQALSASRRCTFSADGTVPFAGVTRVPKRFACDAQSLCETWPKAVPAQLIVTPALRIRSTTRQAVEYFDVTQPLEVRRCVFAPAAYQQELRLPIACTTIYVVTPQLCQYGPNDSTS